MPDDRDSLFGQLAVERAFLTQDELDETLEAQERGAEAMGVRMPLAQILVTKGLLTKDQAQELLNAVAVQTGEARLVGGYEVVAPLGQGGMGAVYKAKKLDTDEFVALKILPPSMATERLVARFKREAEITSGLESEHIVRCVEFGYDEKRKCHFCALEYIEGEDLGKRLKRDGAIPEAEATEIARAVAEALRHAHLNGLVHRDVKPANIMVTPEGTAKLLDLGLARPAGEDAARLTQDGLFVGSAYYASPEQGRGEADLDVRSDIYSLGGTLYHMVTGDPPFAGLPAAEVVQKHSSDTIPWPATANPDLSQGLSAIIAKMMAKAPDERYETPGDFAADLDLLTEGREPGALAAPPKKSTVAKRPRAKSRAAPSGRRSTPKRSGADAPPRAREHGRGPSRQAASKLPYAVGGGAVAVLAILALVFAGGPERKPRERAPSPPLEAVAPEAAAALPIPPVAESEPAALTVAEGEPPEPAEALVPEVAPELVPQAPGQIDLSVPTGPEPPVDAALDLTSGLVAHWEFDEGTAAATAADSSGNGHNGSNLNVTTGLPGRVGNCYAFNGSSSHVAVPSLGQTFTKATFSVWVNIDEIQQNNDSIIHTDDWSDGSLHYMFGRSGRISFCTNGGGQPEARSVFTAADIGNWVHLAATYDSTANPPMTHYRNGSPDGTGGERGTTLDFTSASDIGSRDTSRWFRGRMDDFRIYDRALSVVEVKALFESRTAPEPAVVAAFPDALGRGLVGHWKFDGTEGAAARDSSGKGAHGKITGAVRVAGKLGGALSFDGSGDTVEFGAADVGPPWSLGLWVKREPGPKRVTTLMNSKRFSLRLKQIGTTDRLGFTTYGVKDYVLDAAAPVGVWCHVTFVGTAEGTSVYVNGVKRASHPAAIGMPMGGVGRGEDHSPKALIDDIRAYDRALSAGEVEALFRGHGPPSEPKTPAKPTRLLAELDEFLMKGDHAVALAWSKEAAGDDRYAELAEEVASVPGVCQAIESRGNAGLAGAQARVGTEVRLRIRIGTISGELKEAAAEKLVVATTYTINREKREKAVDVHWKALALDQVDEFAREGGWKPEGADAAVARAYLELGRGKVDAAAKALGGAGDHPFAAHLLRKIDGLSKPPEAARSKRDTPPPTLTLDLGRGVRMEMVYVKPGRFVMGGTEDANPRSAYQGIEKPKHEVTITQGFYLGKYEVTQSQYEAVMGANPSKRKGPDLPVEQVTWHQAVQFCLLASGRMGKLVRLPTEAEWEYACRAGSAERYSFGSDAARLSEFAWHKGNAGGRTHPVGQKTPNAWGLHDMHGNVWEWVADWYAADYYAKSPAKDPQGPDTGDRRLLRGGSWFFDVGYKCRSAFRHHNLPKRPYQTLGFRAVVSLSPAPEADGKKGTMSPSTAELVAEFVETGAMEEVYWDSLRAKVVDALAREETGVDAGIECRPGAKYLIVPRPDDRWSAGASVDNVTYVGRQGYPRTKADSRNSLLIGSLCYTTGSSDPGAFRSVQKAPITSEAD
ncbi:MAG: SUMF1/EgtB/PvdO family nonheme iron enzyme, partial [Planctomycetota bacterium]